jgi:hypothetical protein
MRTSLERKTIQPALGRSLESTTVSSGVDNINVSIRERPRSRRGLRAWRTHMGAPGNLGGLVVFTATCGMDNPLIKSRHSVGRTTLRANHAPTGDTAERRKRSEAGRATRRRSSS